MVEITEFKDYRAFLKAKYEEVKGKTLSFEKVAQKLGASKSFFKLLIDQKRNTTMDRLCEIAKILNLSEFEKQYIIFLFLYNTSQEESAKTYFQSIMLSMHYSRPQDMPVVDPNPSVPKEFFYSWLALQIICLTGFADFYPEASKIHERLGGDKVAKLHQVSEVLSWMIEKKLLVQQDGKWVSSEDNYHAPTDDFDSQQYKLYEAGLNRTLIAIKNIKSLPMPNSRFHTYFAALSVEDIREIEKLYDKLSEKIVDSFTNCESPDRVVCFSNSFFPVTV